MGQWVNNQDSCFFMSEEGSFLLKVVATDFCLLIYNIGLSRLIFMTFAIEPLLCYFLIFYFITTMSFQNEDLMLYHLHYIIIYNKNV